MCLDFPEIVEQIEAFPSEDELNETLDKFVAEIINAKFSVDSVQAEVSLP